MSAIETLEVWREVRAMHRGYAIVSRPKPYVERVVERVDELRCYDEAPAPVLGVEFVGLDVEDDARRVVRGE